MVAVKPNYEADFFDHIPAFFYLPLSILEYSIFFGVVKFIFSITRNDPQSVLYLWYEEGNFYRTDRVPPGRCVKR